MASGKHDRNEERQDQGKSAAGRQTENSRQSMKNASGAKPAKGESPDSGSPAQRDEGMGSSQRQDRGTPDLRRDQGGRSPGTPDIERGGSSDSRDSLVDDPTGAFKERP